MKRILLAALCALALTVAGCATVNQTNSFVEMPAAGPTATPAWTQPPQATAAPEATQPLVQLVILPTPAPGTTNAPDAPTATPTVTPTPEGSPSGFNG